MTKPTKPQFTVRPTAYRAWNGHQMVDVQTLSWNAGGMLWHGAGNQMGWAWINPEYKGWSESNPKPGEGDIYPVMQWTGEKDSVGNDIWEGDIMASRGNYITDVVDEDGNYPDLKNVVVWNRKGPRFALKPVKEYVEHSKNPIPFDRDYPWVVDITCFKEVVGNVFQNPELLES